MIPSTNVNHMIISIYKNHLDISPWYNIITTSNLIVWFTYIQMTIELFELIVIYLNYRFPFAMVVLRYYKP
jgi:hypothetical protein